MAWLVGGSNATAEALRFGRLAGCPDVSVKVPTAAIALPDHYILAAVENLVRLVHQLVLADTAKPIVRHNGFVALISASE